MSAKHDTLSAERRSLSVKHDTLSAERHALSVKHDTLSAKHDTLSAEPRALSARCSFHIKKDCLGSPFFIPILIASFPYRVAQLRGRR
ncbi:hypothetical protein [Sporosarcina sp. UB5]|uniref:hypothetical protein n=1 Tax=Sporosarcina sp. UB5 TaxID=3047463 RepID=UPI003D7BD110